MLEGIFTAAGTLILVVAILVLCYYTTRKLGKLQLGGSVNGSYVRLLDRVAVGQDKAVALVQAGGKYFLLGIASSQITVLSELDKEQLEESGNVQTQSQDFKSIMEMFRDRKKQK